MADFKNKKIAILGWGVSGEDAAKYLLSQGADINILDEKKEKELDFSGFDIRKTKKLLGPDYLRGGLSNFDFVFRAPGVYRKLTQISEAEKRGVVITSSMQLFFDLCPAKIIGVTGTKGKGTTSTLIYEILKKEGFDVLLAGNIGFPVLELLPKLNKNSWVVLELSSFQLIDMIKSPHVAVVLNITEDHLDWHKDRREYVEAKTNIVRHQEDEDFCVLAFDYKDPKNFSKLTQSKVFYFSNSQKVEGSYVLNKKIYLKIGDKKQEVGNTKNLLLRGKHNWENVCAAVCASYLVGASLAAIKAAVYNFKGLEHRLELVDEIGGIKFYNDSFSTNPQTTTAAIQSFEEPITLILGGSDKGLSYDELAAILTERSNIMNIILIGAISKTIASALTKARFNRKIFMLNRSSMKKIVKLSLTITPKNGVVLLSPGTASFDMFKNYKERGEKFKQAVVSLRAK